MELLFIWELMMRQQKEKGLKSFVEFKSLIKNWKSSNLSGYAKTISLKLVL